MTIRRRVVTSCSGAASQGGVLAIGIAGSAVVWWRHQQGADARALRISVPAGWAVISTPSAPGPHGLPASMDLEGPQAGSFFVLWTTSPGGIGFTGTATSTTVGHREVDVGGRKVTMDVLRVKPEDAMNAYALSFVMPEQVNGQTFNFSGLCFTGRSTSSPACSALFQSWTWEPQATAPGIRDHQLVVALP